ncbi:methionyl-tRNA formyltransferase [Candidatus Uhrbacteria bacterium RIFCSPHIGHO2_01_FULL_63_20]|uniref:Methionyl-tRNA formyltransferase n=1 Tax=Candidatus Uhrbacteria bacterium RIFCSPHIGHO2_01_FULL_63_20 TaxID=1802385 RepID=A0A1F7TKK2_9BACT|nr:MAG: methionyl-tRNA formyltransferase [Candidatus Uhrbacteria bacterium RIFCSPHIGHO2_01_FULL_63_20]
MKIVFFGTPSLAVPFLETLVDNPGIQVVAAVTQPDKPVGRRHELAPSPLKRSAQMRGIPVFEFASLKKDPSAVETLKALGADAFVVVAYGKLIPADILNIPRLGCVNVHPSLLPKYRGPSPMQWAIANGDPDTGVTIMQLDEGMDTGPILAFETIGLDDTETLTSLTKKVMATGPALLTSTLKRFAAGEITPIKQDESKATITNLLDREDGRIDWKKGVAGIERMVRAYEGWPGTWTEWNGKRLKVLSVQPTDLKADFPPGTVQVKDGRLMVEGGDGTLEILTIQPEGKAAMPASAFLAGYSEINGATLA